MMFKHLAWSVVKLHATSHAMNIEQTCKVKDQGLHMPQQAASPKDIMHRCIGVTQSIDHTSMTHHATRFAT